VGQIDELIEGMKKVAFALDIHPSDLIEVFEAEGLIDSVEAFCLSVQDELYE